MASNKPYDPNRVPYELEKLNLNVIETPLLNRATQGLYPPGSTFKVVTAAAGLESGTITPETTINAPGTIIDEGHVLANDFTQDWGNISLDTALTNSVNTWFGQLGQKVGQDQLFETMEKFGFNSTPPIDLPNEGRESEVAASGVKGEHGLLTKNDPVDLARVAIGQERLQATPLQMAMVAAAVANGGKLMKPQIWNRVVDPDGRVVKRLDPSVYGEPISAKTAEELTTAMEGVVREGTGTNAADLRRPGRRQDRHRGNALQRILRRRHRREPGLVHGLRTGERTEDRDRRLGRVHARSSATTSRRRSSATSRKRS